MGLLAALDYYASLPSGESPDSVEIEYRLYSWGEIFPPFFGDREHSTVARFILLDYPFKLFSSSTPYDDPLPQKLTLTFKAPQEVKKDAERVKHSGIFPSEIAREFAAFLSVITRRRVFIGVQTRYDGLPIEQEADTFGKSSHQERQLLKEIDPSETYMLLKNLQRLERRIADAFILALRLYHTAVQMLFTEPEFSYLLLVTCLETISSVVYSDYQPDDKYKYLDSKFHGLRDLAKQLGFDYTDEFVNLLLKNENYTFRKLSRFVQENLPDRFWYETQDDAKPNYVFGVVGAGPDGKGQLKFSVSDKTLQTWEKIERNNLERSLRSIYVARSKLIHEGIRLPSSIVLGHYRMIPVEATLELLENSGTQGGSLPKIPPLLTFERLVSYSLVNYLRMAG